MNSCPFNGLEPATLELCFSPLPFQPTHLGGDSKLAHSLSAHDQSEERGCSPRVELVQRLSRVMHLYLAQPA